MKKKRGWEIFTTAYLFCLLTHVRRCFTLASVLSTRRLLAGYRRQIVSSSSVRSCNTEPEGSAFRTTLILRYNSTIAFYVPLDGLAITIDQRPDSTQLFNTPPTDFYIHPCSTTTSIQRSVTAQSKTISEKRHGTTRTCTVHGWGREAAGQSLVQTVTFSRNLVHAGTRRYTILLSSWRSLGEDAGGYRANTTQRRPARYIVVWLKWKVSSFPGFSGALRSTVTAALREEWSWGRAPALERAHVHVVHTINTIATSGTPAAKGSHERCQKRACSWRRGHPRRRYWYPMDVCAALPSLTLVASASPLSLPPPPLRHPLSLPPPRSIAFSRAPSLLCPSSRRLQPADRCGTRAGVATLRYRDVAAGLCFARRLDANRFVVAALEIGPRSNVACEKGDYWNCAWHRMIDNQGWMKGVWIKG